MAQTIEEDGRISDLELRPRYLITKKGEKELLKLSHSAKKSLLEKEIK